jgi:hypothetical protein
VNLVRRPAINLIQLGTEEVITHEGRASGLGAVAGLGIGGVVLAAGA